VAQAGLFCEEGRKSILILVLITRKKAEIDSKAKPDESSVTIESAWPTCSTSRNDAQPLPEIGGVSAVPVLHPSIVVGPGLGSGPLFIVLAGTPGFELILDCFLILLLAGQGVRPLTAVPPFAGADDDS
jgi:hypothetical protein